MTTAALTLVSRQQLFAIRPSVVMAPLEWPAAPISFGSIRPDNGPFGVLSALSTSSMTKLMSPGWFPMSPASAPPGVSLLDNGNNGSSHHVARGRPGGQQFAVPLGRTPQPVGKDDQRVGSLTRRVWPIPTAPDTRWS